MNRRSRLRTSLGPARVAGFERSRGAPHGPGVELPQRVQAESADHPRDESDQRAEPEPQRAGRRMRRADGRDGGGSVLGVAGRPHRQDVVLEQLEQHAELESRRDVAQHRARDRPGDERPRDHHLRHTHEVQSHERAPREQQELQLETHVKSSSGTGAAVGTS